MKVLNTSFLVLFTFFVLKLHAEELGDGLTPQSASHAHLESIVSEHTGFWRGKRCFLSEPKSSTYTAVPEGLELILCPPTRRNFDFHQKHSKALIQTIKPLLSKKCSSSLMRKPRTLGFVNLVKSANTPSYIRNKGQLVVLRCDRETKRFQAKLANVGDHILEGDQVFLTKPDENFHYEILFNDGKRSAVFTPFSALSIKEYKAKYSQKRLGRNVLVVPAGTIEKFKPRKFIKVRNDANMVVGG